MAQVILNRVESGRFGADVCAVVKAPRQFGFIRNGILPDATAGNQWETARAIAWIALSAGWKKDSWSIDVFLKNATNTRAELARFSECAALTCGDESYTVFAQPRTLGVRFSKEF